MSKRVKLKPAVYMLAIAMVISILHPAAGASGPGGEPTDRKRERIAFGRAVISFYPMSFKLRQKQAKDSQAVYVYISPRPNRSGEQVNSSFGIILEKVRADADPILGFVNQMMQFGVYEEHKFPTLTNEDDFMKIPNSCGTIFKKAYPDGRPHTILFVVSTLNGISIKVIADTTSDTFDALLAEYKNIVKSFKVTQL